MKTQNTTLKFNKNSVAELNDEQLQDVNGGSLISFIITVSIVTFTIK